MVVLFDAHCHILLDEDARRTPPEQFAVPPDTTVRGRMLCGFGPEDWPVIAEQSSRWPCSVAAYGVHPWRAEEVDPLWPELLEEKLAADPTAWLGEAGLDVFNSDFSNMEAQLAIFRTQLRLARRLDRKLNLHCVKTWDKLIPALDKEYFADGAGAGVIAHSFAGPHQKIQALAERGAYFTVGPLFSRRDSQRIRAKAALFPLDRLLLESDDFLPPGTDSVAELAYALKWLAGVRKMPEDELAAVIADNSRRLFAHD